MVTIKRQECVFEYIVYKFEKCFFWNKINIFNIKNVAFRFHVPSTPKIVC